MSGENKSIHLQMIQGIIDRMGSNCFSIKEWSLAITVGTYMFANKTDHYNVVIAIFPLIVLWVLDAYYLLLERQYRALYNEIRQKDEKEIDFNMDIQNLNLKMKDTKKYSLFCILISKSILPFYISCIGTTLFIYLTKF